MTKQNKEKSKTANREFVGRLIIDVLTEKIIVREAIKLFPSLGIELVIKTDFNFLSTEANCKLVLSVRIVSLIVDFGSLFNINSLCINYFPFTTFFILKFFFFFCLYFGTEASTLIPNLFSISS